jgi:hypothetical protein
MELIPDYLMLKAMLIWNEFIKFSEIIIHKKFIIQIYYENKNN